MTAFEVLLRHATQPTEPGATFMFALEPGDEIVFGRAADVDVPIPDGERKVSSRHGRIRCSRQGELVAHDLGSLNGTFLSGEKLQVSEGQTLESGAALRVGDYELLVTVAAAAFEETIRTRDVHTAADRLAATLDRLYTSGLDLEPDARRTSLRAAVTEAVDGLSPREGAALLERVLDPPPGGAMAAMSGPGAWRPTAPAAPGAAPLATPSMSEASSTPSTVAPAGADADTVASAVLRQVATELVPGAELAGEDDLRRFGELLTKVCTSTLTWLAKGLESRSVFAQEFGAEVTLVFKRSNNPLKSMSRDELVRFLLDWREPTDPDTRDHYLENVLKDLTEHQVGVLAGVKEAVLNVLQRLSPDRVEAMAKGGKGWSRGAKAWAAYRDLHSQLAEEQGKLFDELISPAIQKGYLARHDGAG